MKEPRPIPGARTLLFDRLFNEEPLTKNEEHPNRVMDREALKASVRREVTRLLNTRTSLPESLRKLASGSVLDYGVPSFSALSSGSQTDRDSLQQCVAASLAIHEPRLKSVRVELVAVPGNPRALSGSIRAVLRIDSVEEPVAFDVRDNGHSSEIDVCMVEES